MQHQRDRTATVVHAIPGRVRVRLDRSLRSAETMQTLAGLLAQIEGVRQVRVNPSTGSVLLEYDPQQVNLEQLYLAANAAKVTLVMPGTPNESGPQDMTPLAKRINSTFGRLDRTVYDFSGGRIDVKTLFPLGLAAAAVRQIATSGGNVAAAPWYVLLWYSFDTFTRYNRRAGRTPEAQGSG